MSVEPVRGGGRTGAFLLLFFLSGFSGLVYESVWSHYLGLLLGHAAYAQVVVLCLFMGGMTAGALGVAQVSGRISNPLLLYALLEAAIGLCALVFHDVFLTAQSVLHEQLIPSLGNPAIVETVRITVSGALILPQSILLGATFPLMAAGLLRVSPSGGGKLVALLYFANSLGAAFGALGNSFLLVPELGLPGASAAAGIINLLIALAVLLLIDPDTDRSGAADRSEPEPGAHAGHSARLLLLVAAATGTASFIYEVAWVRMLSLVLGSSIHAFEMMLSAFILGLAIGSLLIHRRIHRLPAPERTLAWIQLAMGLAAAATLSLYMDLFPGMQWAIENLEKTPAGYLQFNAFSFLLPALVMIPVTIFAGMTLPLLTYSMLQLGGGEGSIGRVYAWNTLGAITGAVLALLWLLPTIGLRNTVLAGAALDMAAGMLLLFWFANGRNRVRDGLAGALCLVILGTAIHRIEFSPVVMASAVYRDGTLYSDDQAQVRFHADGRTATIDVLDMQSGPRMITTNGKPDGALMLDDRLSIDEATVILLAAVPLALHPDVRNAAVIGLGTGMTTDTLLRWPLLDRVDTIEIEAQMAAGAKLFGDKVALTFNDPRSRIHFDDARTFLSGTGSDYDIIISEPSNPWVSGVAGLFSREFFGRVRTRLATDGVFGQWLHLYELSPETVALVLNSFAHEFPDYRMFQLIHNELLIVGGGGAGNPLDGIGRLLAHPPLKERLARIGIRSQADLEIRRVPGIGLIRRYFSTLHAEFHSDFQPTLPYAAIRDRFMGASTGTFRALREYRLPVLQLLADDQDNCADAGPELTGGDQFRGHFIAQEIDRGFRLADTPATPSRNRKLLTNPAGRLLRRLEHCAAGLRYPGFLQEVHQLAEWTLPYMHCGEAAPIWKKVADSACMEQLAEPERDWLRLYRAMATRDLADLRAVARRLLEDDADPTSSEASLPLHALIVSLLVDGQAKEAQQLLSRFPHSNPPEIRKLLDIVSHDRASAATKPQPANTRQ